MTGLKTRITAAVLAASFAAAGAAQAAPFNIWTKSQSDVKLEQVQKKRYGGHRYHHRRNNNAAIAIGTIGAIGAIAAGAAIANERNRYYYDDGYEYYDGPPPRYYRDDYCASNGNRPDHYPAPQGC